MNRATEIAALRWRPDGPTAGLVLDQDGSPLARYGWSPSANNPAFHPVRAEPGEASLTNGAPADHPWHHGLWWSWKYVNRHLFWEDDPVVLGPGEELGRSIVRGHEAAEDGQGGIVLRQSLELGSRQRVLLDESRVLTLRPDIGADGPGWSIDWSLAWTARERCEMRVTEGESWGGYAGLSFRAARSMALRESIVADGRRRGAARVHGKGARWVAVSGCLDGVPGATLGAPGSGGVAILSHPGNPRHPTPAYALSADEGDGFGFLAASPVFHERLCLETGEGLALRFQVLIFPGAADPDLLERAWETYAATGLD